MRYVVLDTNCLVQVLPSRSRYHKIWTDFLTGKYRLCVSTEILLEYEEILSVLASPEVAHNVVEAQLRIHGDDSVEMVVVKGGKYSDSDEKEIMSLAKKYLGDGLETSISYTDKIERTKNGKFRSIVKV